jgi:hypothetical protein
MGLLSRLLIPRKVRRVAHPVRAVRRKATPKSVKRARRALHPINNATYSVTRSLNTKPTSRQLTYHHGTCTMNHRSPEAAAKCRRTY